MNRHGEVWSALGELGGAAVGAAVLSLKEISGRPGREISHKPAGSTRLRVRTFSGPHVREPAGCHSRTVAPSFAAR
jgi:hypothetical protein